MADSDLPTWSFRANWREGITERLEFLTDVLRGAEGAEQRRCLRITPRRTIEADFLLSGAERTFYDLFMNRLAGMEMMVPLYWDVASLTTAVASGSSTRLNFDNTYREFGLGYAILTGKTALEYEVVEIVGLDAGGADIAEETARSWPVGSKLIPLRRALIDDAGSPNHYTAGVASVTVRFLLTAPNPWFPPADGSPVYLTRPVFLDEPNWVESLDVTYDRDTIRLDNSLSLPYQVDPTGRAMVGQSHRWFLPGRQRLAEFRDLIYRHRGRAGSFWLPTFKADLKLVNSPGAAATQITVENVGYGYTGGPTSGREYIAIKHSGGTLIRKVTSVIPGTTSATERLNLDAPLGLALSPGQVRRISFADVARFDQDEFEITHHGGIDNLSECQGMFRTFKATRSSPDPISFPIPNVEMNNAPCGFSFQLVNAGFEFGDMTGWTFYAGGGSAIQVWLPGTSAQVNPHTGTYFMSCVGGGSFVSFGQDLQIPVRFHQRIDDGEGIFANFAAYQNSGVPLNPSNPANNDQGRLYVAFFNAGGTELGRVYSAWNFNFAWTRMDVPATAVPPGTRRIRVATENIPEDSTNDNFWDTFDQPVLVFS